MTAGLLDTSVFIADETGRQLYETRIPDEVATTVITVAELTKQFVSKSSQAAM
jgi:predicted nucleic acid-binding protein